MNSNSGRIYTQWAKSDGTYPTMQLVDATVSGNIITVRFLSFELFLNLSTGVMSYQYADGQGHYPIKTISTT